jgi:hypothetical protein
MKRPRAILRSIVTDGSLDPGAIDTVVSRTTAHDAIPPPRIPGEAR